MMALRDEREGVHGASRERGLGAEEAEGQVLEEEVMRGHRSLDRIDDKDDFDKIHTCVLYDRSCSLFIGDP